MTTETQTKKEWPKKTVLATVESVGKDKSGEHWLLGLRIPSFKSEYPTIIYNLTEEQVKPFRIGATYSLVLTQENLKTSRDGQPKNASYPANFFYGLVGIAEPAATETKPVAYDADGNEAKRQAPPRPQPRDSFQEAADAKDASIRRQVALKAAVEFGGYAFAHLGTSGKISTELIETTAERFYQWLSNPPAENKFTEAFGLSQSDGTASESTAAPKAPKTGQETPRQAVPKNLRDEIIALANQIGVKPSGIPVWVRSHIEALKDVEPKTWTEEQLALIRVYLQTEVKALEIPK